MQLNSINDPSSIATLNFIVWEKYANVTNRYKLLNNFLTPTSYLTSIQSINVSTLQTNQTLS